MALRWIEQNGRERTTIRTRGSLLAAVLKCCGGPDRDGPSTEAWKAGHRRWSVLGLRDPGVKGFTEPSGEAGGLTPARTNAHERKYE